MLECVYDESDDSVCLCPLNFGVTWGSSIIFDESSLKTKCWLFLALICSFLFEYFLLLVLLSTILYLDWEQGLC